MSKVDAVLGTQWGDEGKGKLVDTIGSKYISIFSVNTQVRDLLPSDWRRQCGPHHYYSGKGCGLPFGSNWYRSAPSQVHHWKRLCGEYIYFVRRD